jgi:hypothetical protein
MRLWKGFLEKELHNKNWSTGVLEQWSVETPHFRYGIGEFLQVNCLTGILEIS